MERSKRGDRHLEKRTKQRHDISEVPEATTHARTLLTTLERKGRVKARKQSQNKQSEEQNINIGNEQRSNIEDQNIEQNVNIGHEDWSNIEEQNLEQNFEDQNLE